MQSLQEWLNSLNFPIQNPVLDGKIHRYGRDKELWFIGSEFPSKKKTGQMFQVATVGNWKTSEKHQYKTDIKYTREESALIKEQRIAAEQKAAREKEEEQERVSVEVQRVLSELEWREETPYTVKKGISVHPLCKIKGGDLIIPIRDINGKIWTAQRIAFDGSKRFSPGGKMQGNFFLFGEPDKILYICEGYATGYSIWKSTGHAVACAMNAGNMPEVSRAFRKKYPKLEMFMAADNDESGVGLSKATKAAEDVGAVVLLPPKEVKDFNDAGGLVIGTQEYVPDLETSLPDIGDKGGALNTIDNLTEVLKRVKITAKYDVIRKKQIITVPDKCFTPDNYDNVTLAYVESWASKFGMSKDQGSNLYAIAEENLYNPVAAWIESSPWDGVSRLNEFLNTVKSKNDDLKKFLMKRWLVSCVAAAYEPRGVSAEGVLVFQGGQAMGKTSWFKKLVPQDLEIIKDGLFIKPDDKDSVKRAVSYWIVELGELDGTFRKSDIAQLKSFITMDRDVLRLPYAKRESFFPRRTVFFASVNEKEFLNDTTGNRRFWVVECESIDYEHKINMQQLWAEVLVLYRNREPWCLDVFERAILDKNNVEFEPSDPVKDLITNKLQWHTTKDSWVWLSSTEILMNLGINSPRRTDATRAGQVLSKMEDVKSRPLHGIKVYFVPRHTS